MRLCVCMDHGGVISPGSHLRRYFKWSIFVSIHSQGEDGRPGTPGYPGYRGPKVLSLSLLRILSDVEKVSFVLGRVMLRSVASSKTGSVTLSLRTGKHSEPFWLLGFLEVKLCDRRASDLKVGVRYCFFTKETFFIHGCRLHTGPLGLNRRYL